MESIIRDINLAESGERKIEWVKRNCDLLRTLEEEFSQTVRQPKAAGEVEGYGQERHDAHHALIAERRYLEADFLVREGVHHQQHRAHVGDRAFLEAREIIGIQIPDVVRDKTHHAVDYNG